MLRLLGSRARLCQPLNRACKRAISQAPLIATTIAPKGQHRGTVFFMHGLGDTSEGFAEMFEQQGRNLEGIKFILPNAPFQSVTINAGMRMPAWYDIVGHRNRADEPLKGIEQAKESVMRLVQEEIAESGLGLDRVVLGGFSQGAALAGHLTVHLKEPPLGLLMLSGYMPFIRSVQVPWTKDEAPHVLVYHGDADPVVLPEWGRESAEKLQQHWGSDKVQLKWVEGMPHCVEEDEIANVLAWLAARFSS